MVWSFELKFFINCQIFKEYYLKRIRDEFKRVNDVIESFKSLKIFSIERSFVFKKFLLWIVKILLIEGNHCWFWWTMNEL